MSFVPRHVPHGERYTYVYYQCRCDLCQKANREYFAQKRSERSAQEKDPDDPRHGTRSFYTNYGCRCDSCTAAHAASCRAYAQSRKAERKAA